MTTCPRCHTTNRDGASFCARCGASFKGLLAAGVVLAQRYTIQRVLGQGGMGAVYLAWDARIQGKCWAVKEMSDASPNQVEQVHLFQAEAQILAGLSHPGLPAVTDFFTVGPRRYLVMEYVDGDTLQDLLDRVRGPLPEAQVLHWAAQLCDVLAYLHERPQPVIHRDIKPANVKLASSGAVKLLDFGLARHHKVGQAGDTIRGWGSMGFASPEQAAGRIQTDARSDIYSLGATLHYLLTYRHPADSPFQFAPLRQLNPAISAVTEAIIMRAVERDPAQRWQSAREMGQAIRSGNVTPLPVPSRPSPRGAPTPPSAPAPHLGPTLDEDAASQHNQRGLALTRAGQDTAALREYQEAVRLNPQRAVYHYNLATTLYRLSRPAEALPAAQAAVALDRTDADYHNRLNQILYSLGRFSEALAAIQEAIRLEPDEPVLHHNLGTVYQALDRHQEAVQAYQQAIDRGADADTVALQGDAYRELGRMREAEQAYQLAIQMEPQEASHYNRLGNLYFAQDRFPDAQRQYERAVRLDPNDAVYHCNLALNYLLLKRPTDAIREYQQAARLDPAYGRPCNELGDVYLTQNKLPEAIRWYQEAVQREPGRALFHRDLGNALHQAGRDREAKSALQEAIRQDPDDHRALNLLGIIHYDEGDYQTALHVQQRALQLQPDNAVFAFNVGMDLEALGRHAEAERHYRLALQLDPNLTEARDRLRQLGKV